MNIFLDLDGTVLDTSERHYGVYHKIVTALHGTPMKKSAYWSCVQNNVNKKEVLRRSAVKTGLLEKFVSSFSAEIENAKYLSQYDAFVTRTVPKVLSVLKKNHSIFIVSLRQNKKNALSQAKTFKLNSLVRSVIIGNKKPNESSWAAKVRLIKPHLSVTKPNVIVGDTEADILAAKQLGLPSAGVLSGLRSKKSLTSLKPTLVIDDIRDLNKNLKRLVQK